MNIDSISRNIFSKKTTDYTFTILFFLIFSMFIIFAIKPSLSTAASLKKEEQDLKRIDNIYESKIINIASIQQLMIESRDDFPLLNQAITTYPKVNKMIEDIKGIADQSSFQIRKAGIADINLLNTKNKNIQLLKVTVEGTSTFEDLLKFTQGLFNQRRLKTISNLSISQDMASGSSSATLKVTMEIQGYYL